MLSRFADEFIVRKLTIVARCIPLSCTRLIGLEFSRDCAQMVDILLEVISSSLRPYP